VLIPHDTEARAWPELATVQHRQREERSVVEAPRCPSRTTSTPTPSTILVTGGAGYIGSHTCVALLDAGHDVVVVDDFVNSSPRALDAVRRVTGRDVVVVEADVADDGALDAAFAARRIDAVIHFAGLKAVGESVVEPVRYYRNNLGSTLELVDAMARHGVDRLVFSSSCTVYGQPDVVRLAEDTRLRPESPYGHTKLFIEQILRDVAVARPTWRVSVLRYFNPVGAHESGELGVDPRGIPNNLMPFLMQVAVGRRPQLNVYGGDYPTRDGTCVRDYIHVVDLAHGHLAALAALEAEAPGWRAYNLGTGVGSTVLEVIAAAREAVGHDLPYEIVGRRAGDVAEVYADPSRAERALGWKAERDLRAMCRDHWRWQSAHPWGFGDPEAVAATSS
jgi:UDP-glucose 4-epimerase